MPTLNFNYNSIYSFRPQDATVNMLSKEDLVKIWTPSLILQDLYVRFRETHVPVGVVARLDNGSDFQVIFDFQQSMCFLIF